LYQKTKQNKAKQNKIVYLFDRDDMAAPHSSPNYAKHRTETQAHQTNKQTKRMLSLPEPNAPLPISFSHWKKQKKIDH
jgi:hypothetical protein